MEEDGRYEIEGELARGGMGIVLRVKDIDLDRTLAMKRMVIAPDATAGASEVGRFARFMEEAQVTAQLDHPAIVPVHELGFDDDGTGWYTMKLVDGLELGEVFELVAEESSDWNLTRALQVLVQVCQALVHAHEKGVVHRDLKPANIMVGSLGEVYVMDWGLAKVEGSELTSPRDSVGEFVEGLGSLQTLDGSVMGTPEFMAPEQARGEVEQVGPQSDVYAVGAMLYQLLSGRPPFSGEARQVVKAVANDEPEPLPGGIRPELAAICQKAMSRELASRYCSARELLKDLQRFLDGRVVGAYEQGTWAELKKWLARNKGVAAGLGAFLLTLIALLGLQWMSGQKIGKSLQEEQKAKREAVLAVEQMAVSQALTAGLHGEQGKAAYWFREGARLAVDPTRRQTHEVRARLAESRSTLPWRALLVPPESHGRIDFGPFARYLIVEHRSRLRCFQIMDIAREKLLEQPAGESWFRAVAVCPSTGRLALAPEQEEGAVVIMDSDGVTELDRFQADGEVGVFAFHPDGNSLFVGTKEGGVYDLEAKRFQAGKFQHRLGRRIGHAVFSPDGARLLTATNRLSFTTTSADWARVFVFNWNGEGEPLFDHLPSWLWPNTLQPRFLANGTQFIYQPEIGRVDFCDVGTGQVLSETQSVYCDFSANEELAVGSGAVHDLVSGEQLFDRGFGQARLREGRESILVTRPHLSEVSFRGGSEPQRIGLGKELVEEIAVSRDGDWLASWDEAGLLKVWKLQNFTWTLPVAKNGTVRWSPGGNYLANGGRPVKGGYPSSRSVIVRESTTGKVVGPEISLDYHLCDLAFSPDEKSLATALVSDEVVLWEIASGKQLANLPSVDSTPRCLQWSPSADRLAVLCKDGSVYEYKIGVSAEASKKLLFRADKVRASVTFPHSLKGLRYSPDGRWLVAWSLGEGISIWDCQRGEQVASPPTRSAFVSSVHVDDEGVRFLDTNWEEAYYEIRDWSFKQEDWRSPIRELIMGMYQTMDAEPGKERYLLSDGYHEWSLLQDKGAVRKMRELAFCEPLFIPETPWVVGVSRLPIAQLRLMDSRDESFLMNPWTEEGAYFYHPELSPNQELLTAVNWHEPEREHSLAHVWNLKALRIEEKISLPAEACSQLSALNAGGQSEQGKWTQWSFKEWLEMWQEFRRRYPEVHRSK